MSKYVRQKHKTPFLVTMVFRIAVSNKQRLRVRPPTRFELRVSHRALHAAHRSPAAAAIVAYALARNQARARIRADSGSVEDGHPLACARAAKPRSERPKQHRDYQEEVE